MDRSGPDRLPWSRPRVLGFAALVALALATSGAPPVHGDPSQSTQGRNCSGKCLNPHPGQFTATDGQTKGDCWVQVWRRWPDGCTHWQWFDRCNKKWDADTAGRPRVTWTCCVH